MESIEVVKTMVTDTGRLTSKAKAKAYAMVRSLQSRIVRAIERGDKRGAKKLQRLLKRSYSLKLLAIDRVRNNHGGITAGVDGFVIHDQETFRQALERDYWKSEPMPAKRRWIPKKPWDKVNKRPLGIPIIFDRIAQAMMLMVTEPEAELKFHDESYGFRPKRSTWDAIESVFVGLNSKSHRSQILDADIEKCFDRIDHQALMNKLPRYIKDKGILSLIGKHLKAGIIEDGIYQETVTGTPQGGILSPLLANIALDGIERCGQPYNVKIVRYADDLVAMGRYKEDVKKTRTAIQEFLQGMGINLSEKKTHIVSREEGFDFLGFNIQMRKGGKRGKLIIMPSKDNVKRHRASIARTIKTSRTQSELIENLNLVLTGWSNYFSSVCSKKTYGQIDKYVFQKLLGWIKSKNAECPTKKALTKYFHRMNTRKWEFITGNGGKKTRAKILTLVKESDTKIQRHVKIRKGVNPYRTEDRPYFEERRKNQLLRSTVGKIARMSGCSCFFCKLPVETNEYGFDGIIHHAIPLSMGGNNHTKNLRLAHRSCHLANPHGSHLNRSKDECGRGSGRSPS